MSTHPGNDPADTVPGPSPSTGPAPSPVDARDIPSATPPRRSGSNRQAFLIGLLLLSVVVVLVMLVTRLLRPVAAPDRPVPDVASSRSNRLTLPEVPPMPRPAASAPVAASAPTAVVPRLEPLPPPIPLAAAPSAQRPPPSSLDAPVFAGPPAGSRPTGAAASRAALDNATASADQYTQQVNAALAKLQGLLGRQGAAPGGAVAANAGVAAGSAGADDRPTPRVQATMLGHRSLTMSKGTHFTCTLKTRVITATSGLVGCQVNRNVYGDDGRVVLVERGSHLDGEYKIVNVKPGLTRIPVLWTRVRTPHGVSVDLDSEATGSLGESGIGGHVDNRWGERIGAALLLSLIEDTVRVMSSDGGEGSTSNNFVFGSTAGQSQKLAERVLEATINIPPLIYENQGSMAGVYVARDVDFSSVYELAPR